VNILQTAAVYTKNIQKNSPGLRASLTQKRELPHPREEDTVHEPVGHVHEAEDPGLTGIDKDAVRPQQHEKGRGVLERIIYDPLGAAERLLREILGP